MVSIKGNDRRLEERISYNVGRITNPHVLTDDAEDVSTLCVFTSVTSLLTQGDNLVSVLQLGLGSLSFIGSIQEVLFVGLNGQTFDASKESLSFLVRSNDQSSTRIDDRFNLSTIDTGRDLPESNLAIDLDPMRIILGLVRDVTEREFTFASLLANSKGEDITLEDFGLDHSIKEGVLLVTQSVESRVGETNETYGVSVFVFGPDRSGRSKGLRMV